MSLLNDYQLSVLAVDVYNRTYGEVTTGINPEFFVDDPETMLGNAEIITTSRLVLGNDEDGHPIDQNADFYAIAYRVGSEIVVSFRGANTLFLGPDLLDVASYLNGDIPEDLRLPSSSSATW